MLPLISILPQSVRDRLWDNFFERVKEGKGRAPDERTASSVHRVTDVSAEWSDSLLSVRWTVAFCDEEDDPDVVDPQVCAVYLQMERADWMALRAFIDTHFDTARTAAGQARPSED